MSALFTWGVLNTFFSVVGVEFSTVHSANNVAEDFTFLPLQGTPYLPSSHCSELRITASGWRLWLFEVLLLSQRCLNIVWLKPKELGTVPSIFLQNGTIVTSSCHFLSLWFFNQLLSLHQVVLSSSISSTWRGHTCQGDVEGKSKTLRTFHLTPSRGQMRYMQCSTLVAPIEFPLENEACLSPLCHQVCFVCFQSTQTSRWKRISDELQAQPRNAVLLLNVPLLVCSS